MEFLREVLSYDPRLLSQFLVLYLVLYAMLKSSFGKRVTALEEWRKETDEKLALLPAIDERTKTILAYTAPKGSLVMEAARAGADLIESPTAELLAREMDRLKVR